jgi:uncharacterized membrane protein
MIYLYTWEIYGGKRKMRVSRLLFLVVTIGLYAGAAWTYELYMANLRGILTLVNGEGSAEISIVYQTSYGLLPVSLASVASLLLGYLIADLKRGKGKLAREEADSLELDVKFALRLLDGDKRKVFSEIVESGGEILQSDLPGRMGFSKYLF